MVNKCIVCFQIIKSYVWIAFILNLNNFIVPNFHETPIARELYKRSFDNIFTHVVPFCGLPNFAVHKLRIGRLFRPFANFCFPNISHNKPTSIDAASSIIFVYKKVSSLIRVSKIQCRHTMSWQLITEFVSHAKTQVFIIIMVATHLSR